MQKFKIKTKPATLLVLSLLLGAAGGFLRANELITSYDRVAGVMARVLHPYSIVLIGFSVFALIMALLLANDDTELPVERRRRTKLPAYAWTQATAFLALFISAMLDMADSGVFGHGPMADEPQYGQFVLALLSAFTAIAMLVILWATVLGQLKTPYGFYMTIPIFWASFWIVLDFGQHAANPIVLSYVYSLLAIIFTTLALYSAAGFFFKQSRVRATKLYTILGIYFSCTVFIGQLIYWLQQREWPVETLTPAVALRFMFVIMHLASLLYWVRLQKLELHRAPKLAKKNAPPPTRQKI